MVSSISNTNTSIWYKFGLVVFYNKSALMDYSVLNPVHTYISYIWFVSE